MPNYILYFVSALLIFLTGACASEQTNQQENKIKQSTPESALDLPIEFAELNDSLILYKNFKKDFNHIIFIDTSRNSKFYDRLSNFDFGEFHTRTYEGNYKYLKEKYPKSYQKWTSSEKRGDLPQDWLPVYQYQNEYFLYAPSDWGNAGKRIINDSSFVYWYMDGPFPEPINSVEKIGDKFSFYIKAFSAPNDTSLNYKLNIIEIDSKTKLSIFEFPSASGSSKYQLYVPKESATSFNMIVNYCKNWKQNEFDFDVINFEELIGKIEG